METRTIDDDEFRAALAGHRAWLDYKSRGRSFVELQHLKAQSLRSVSAEEFLHLA